MAMMMATTTSTCCNRVCYPFPSSFSPRVDFSTFSSHLLCLPSPVSFSSLPLRIVPFPRSCPPHMASIFASSARTENVEVETATKVKFPRSIVAAGGSEALSLVGTGFREKSIAFIGVKVYAIGLYLDNNGILPSLASWKGKGGNELSKDNSFFKAVVGAPVEKAIKIVLVRDVDGATFWGALDEALTPRLKDANAGAAGQEALNAFGEVFRGKSLKQGTSIYLTWIQPSKLQVSLSGDYTIDATVEASIISSPLVSALYDVYLGENPVSPTAKASTATGLAALL